VNTLPYDNQVQVGTTNDTWQYI